MTKSMCKNTPILKATAYTLKKLCNVIYVYNLAALSASQT